VGESGDRKSEVDRISSQPIKDWEKILTAQYNAEVKTYKNKLEARKLQISIISKTTKDPKKVNSVFLDVDEEPQSPMQPIIFVEEPSYEALVKLFAVSQPSLGLFSDEGGRLFGGYGMKPENILKTASGLSNMIDGKEITRSRAGEGSFVLYGRRLSLHVMIQPVVLFQIASNQILRDQGLFLIDASLPFLNH
jgi:Protein of unknown function (DUF3987)